MAAKTAVNPSYGVEGQYRMFTCFLNGVNQGDYLETGLTSVYSVTLTHRGMNSAMPGALWVSAGGSGRVTFVCYVSSVMDLSVTILGQ